MLLFCFLLVSDSKSVLYLTAEKLSCSSYKYWAFQNISRPKEVWLLKICEHGGWSFVLVDEAPSQRHASLDCINISMLEFFRLIDKLVMHIFARDDEEEEQYNTEGLRIGEKKY